MVLACHYFGKLSTSLSETKNPFKVSEMLHCVQHDTFHLSIPSTNGGDRKYAKAHLINQHASACFLSQPMNYEPLLFN